MSLLARRRIFFVSAALYIDQPARNFPSARVEASNGFSAFEVAADIHDAYRQQALPTCGKRMHRSFIQGHASA